MDQNPEQLSGIFQALADPTRRAVLGRLGRGPASISELAKPFDMALPSFMKHIHFLEGSGWIRTRKEGRVRTCAIEKKPFAAVEAWLSAQRAFWEGRAPTGSSGLSPPPGRRKNQNDPIFKSRRESSRRPVGHLERLNGPRELEQWWVPAPAKCKVLDMDLRPGGSFVTRISENGGDFMPHLNACFLAIDDLERIDSQMLWSVYGDPPNNRMDGELSACRRNEPVGGN